MYTHCGLTQIDRRRNPRCVATGTDYLTSAKAISLAMAALLLGLLTALWDELPQWRIGGTNSTTASSVAYLPRPLACPVAGAEIAIIGDSHVAGSRMAAGGTPFAAVLEQALAGRVVVARYGAGGQTAARGEDRWRGRTSK